MDNYEAIAYACVALRNLKKDGIEITEDNLKGQMLYLMDMNSEREIYEKYIKHNA